MKVCILGNSHIACVKHAWDAVAERYPEVDIVFFGSSANTLEYARADQGLLLPGTEQVARSWALTSGGSKDLAFERFDHVVIHGVLPFLTVWNRLFRWVKKNRGASRAFIRDCFWRGHELTHGVLEQVDQLDKSRVLLTPRPSPIRSGEEKPLSEAAYRELSDFLESGFQDLGYRVRPQPLVSLTEGFNTLRRYNEQAIGLGKRPDGLTLAPEGDRNHMNLQYGELYLDDLLFGLGQ